VAAHCAGVAVGVAPEHPVEAEVAPVHVHVCATGAAHVQGPPTAVQVPPVLFSTNHL